MELDQDQTELKIARQSALIYLLISLGIALTFWAAASFLGGYSPVARIGGSVWVGLLSLIVSMPLVTARVKRKVKGSA
jgi:hypothetical protein